MIKLIPGILLFIFCIASFVREVRLSAKSYLEQDRLGDEHILREIARYKREKDIT